MSQVGLEANQRKKKKQKKRDCYFGCFEVPTVAASWFRRETKGKLVPMASFEGNTRFIPSFSAEQQQDNRKHSQGIVRESPDGATVVPDVVIRHQMLGVQIPILTRLMASGSTAKRRMEGTQLLAASQACY